MCKMVHRNETQKFLFAHHAQGGSEPDGGEPEIAAWVPMDTVERMIRHGERRPLMLSNKLIDANKRSEVNVTWC